MQYINHTFVSLIPNLKTQGCMKFVKADSFKKYVSHENNIFVILTQPGLTYLKRNYAQSRVIHGTCKNALKSQSIFALHELGSRQLAIT